MSMNRREFFTRLGKTLAFATVCASLPRAVLASWNKEAFAAEALDQAIAARYPGLAIEDSDAVKLKAPTIAENGSVVPISVSTSLEGVTSISVFVEKNPAPLAASFHLSPLSVADVSIRIRMGETSQLITLVESQGKLYRAQQEVKVTIGGCGG